MTDDPGGTCPSCGSANVGRFCPECGQRALGESRALLPWLRDALAEVLSLDGRTTRTLRTLATSPGALTDAWIRGERSRYTPPFRLYLVSSVAFFLMLSWLGNSPMPLLQVLFGIDGMEQQEHIRAIAEVAPSGWSPDLLRAAAETFQAAVEDAVTIGLIIVVPVTAVILTLLFWRARKWYFVDHVVHALHVISFGLLAWTVAWPILVLDLPVLGRALAPLVWVGLLLYGAVSFSRVYRLRRLQTAVVLPSLLLLGAVGGLGILQLTVSEERVGEQLAATLLFWEEAYAAYGERIYDATTDPGRSISEREELFGLAEVVYEHAPVALGRLDPHFVIDFAELRRLRDDPAGALVLFRRAAAGLTTPLEAVGGSALASWQLGDSVQARALAAEFLDLLEGGARGYHPERGNLYRREALEILESAGG